MDYHILGKKLDDSELKKYQSGDDACFGLAGAYRISRANHPLSRLSRPDVYTQHYK